LKENQFHPVFCSDLHAIGTKNEEFTIRSERKKTQGSGFYVDLLNYAALFICNIAFEGTLLVTVIRYVPKREWSSQTHVSHVLLRGNVNL